MSFAQFFAAYWWLMFPVFGMLMALMGMFQNERRNTQTMDLIKSYIDQGKEPPPELIRLAASEAGANDFGGPSRPGENRAWSAIVFTALAAGFGVGYYYVQAQDWAFAFLIVAIVMGVMAVGAILLLIFGRKS